MNSKREFWQQLLADEAPTEAEMAAAEAELRELAAEQDLTAEQLAALTNAPRRRAEWEPSVAVAAENAPSRLRRATATAALAAALISIGWMGRQVAWPGERDSLHTLDLVSAQSASEDPRHLEEGRRSSLLHLIVSVKWAAVAVRLAAEDEDVEVAAAARALITDLAGQMASGKVVSQQVDLGLDASQVVLAARGATTGERLAALDHIGKILQGTISTTLSVGTSEKALSADVANGLERIKSWLVPLR